MATPDDDDTLCQDFTTEGGEFESCAKGICNLHPVVLVYWRCQSISLGDSI